MNLPVIAALLLVIFITQMGVGIIAPIMPIYALELGATGLTLGLMVAGFSIARGVTQPIIGSYSDRFGKKRFLVFGLLIYAIVAVTYSFSGSVIHLIIIRFFHGVGAAMTVPMAMAIMADMSPQGKEGQYMGLLNIAIFAGIGGGPLLGGVFRDLWGMHTAFYAMALFALVHDVPHESDIWVSSDNHDRYHRRNGIPNWSGHCGQNIYKRAITNVFR